MVGTAALLSQLVIRIVIYVILIGNSCISIVALAKCVDKSFQIKVWFVTTLVINVSLYHNLLHLTTCAVLVASKCDLISVSIATGFELLAHV